MALSHYGALHLEGSLLPYTVNWPHWFVYFLSKLSSRSLLITGSYREQDLGEITFIQGTVPTAAESKRSQAILEGNEVPQ